MDEVFTTGGDAWPAGYGHRIIRDVHGYSKLALWDVLVKSSNIGMCMLGQRLGNTGLYNALNGFKYGQRTGIELPAEDSGLLNPLKKWNRFSTESVSQGYEMRVTPLQLARGMCAYANGGRLVDPHVIGGTLDENGRLLPTVPRKPFSACPQVVDSAVSADVRRVLCDVLIRGTASKARGSIYNIFGKTGTAHSAVNGQYNESNYTSSFIGGAPFENPRLVIAVVVHDPDKSLAHFGGTVAAPAATNILEQSLQYLQVPASGDLPLPPPNVAEHLYAYNAKLYEKPKQVETASVNE
ncbi:MAG: penicillin-binding transpeptidase domain-containing protein [Tepidisphaeraceae bacterium]